MIFQFFEIAKLNLYLVLTTHCFEKIFKDLGKEVAYKTKKFLNVLGNLQDKTENFDKSGIHVVNCKLRNYSNTVRQTLGPYEIRQV